MNDSDLKSDQSKVEARFRLMVILYGAMLLSISTLVFIPSFVFRPNLNRELSPLFFALIALAFLIIAFSFWLRRKMLLRAVEQQNLVMVQQAYIVSWALCEAVCMLGLITYFVLNHAYYYHFFFIGAFGMIAHKPLRNYLREASFKNQNYTNEQHLT